MSLGQEFEPVARLITVPIGIALLLFTGMLSWTVYNKIIAIVLTLLFLVPVLNFLIILLVNSRANNLLKEHGFKSGLLGVNIKKIESAVL